MIKSPDQYLYPLYPQRFHFCSQVLRSGLPEALGVVPAKRGQVMVQKVSLPSRGVQWRSLNSVGASIGDPFEGAGVCFVLNLFAFQKMKTPKMVLRHDS